MKNMTTEELQNMLQNIETELERREQKEKDRLRAEKDARYKEVIHAYENFEELRSKFVEDYGYFTFEKTNKKGDSHSWFWNSIGLL